MLPSIHIVWLLRRDDYQARRKLELKFTPGISEHRKFWRSGDGKHG